MSIPLGYGFIFSDWVTCVQLHIFHFFGILYEKKHYLALRELLTYLERLFSSEH